MRKLSTLILRLDRTSQITMPYQLAEQVRRMVHDNVLKRGDRLPATRVLARDLQVSRSVIVEAYEQLVAEGYLISGTGSGHFVASELPGGLPWKAPAPNKTVELRAADRSDGVKPFQPCAPDSRLFPAKDWARTLSRLARQSPHALVEQHDPFGDPRLRSEIAAHLAEWRGVNAVAEQIYLAAGTCDAIKTIFEVMSKRGERVGLEDPGYLPVRDAVLRLGLDPEFLGVDQEGTKLPSRKNEFVVLTPTFQFPLGGAMTLERKAEYLKWAHKNECWIIEDDYDSEFRYTGKPLQALAGLDHLSRTIYVGTFSKTFFPGIRLGYVVLPEALVDELSSALRTRSSNASMVPQRALAEFMSNGSFYRHLRRSRRIYAQRRNTLFGLLEGAFGSLPHLRKQNGGMQIAFEFKNKVCNKALEAELTKRALGPELLAQYYRRSTGASGLLIGFCLGDEDEMEAAFPALRQVISAFENV